MRVPILGGNREEVLETPMTMIRYITEGGIIGVAIRIKSDQIMYDTSRYTYERMAS